MRPEQTPLDKLKSSSRRPANTQLWRKSGSWRLKQATMQSSTGTPRLGWRGGDEPNRREEKGEKRSSLKDQEGQALRVVERGCSWRLWVWESRDEERQCPSRQRRTRNRPK